MRWKTGRRSTNIENRQKLSGKAAAGGGGIFFIMALVVFFMGGDPTYLVKEGVQRSVSGVSAPANPNLSEEETAELSDFVSVVLASTEDVWDDIFASKGGRYQQPSLVLFTGVVNSACGRMPAAAGPFYCGNDRKIYIDLEFYHDMRTKMNAPGDFAQAYVIAHEVGHHAQNMLGVLGQVNKAKSRSSKIDANALSVRTELQADCFSGVWAHKVQNDFNMVEEGDIDEALNAASKIGDDVLQKQAQGYVIPESFTHGSSKQRKNWFLKGLKSGNIDSCNSFEASSL